MSIRTKIKDYVRLFGALGIAYWCLTRWADFNEKQAIALAILVAIFANVIWLVARHTERNKFEPFTLTFQPEWLQIVTEQDLMSEGELAQVWKMERSPGFRLIFEELS